MKRALVLLISLIILPQMIWSQTPNNCGNVTSTGTNPTYGSGYTDPNPACGANVPGIVTSSPATWTGSGCTGFITSTVVGPPTNCIVISYGAVNTDDYGTITTNTGGTLTLAGVNMAVNGNVIGPYNCGSGFYGNVLLTVCSDIPFSSVTLTNTGCSSGWVINCADQTTCNTSGCSVTCSLDNFTANISACAAGAYSTTGIVEFTNPPTTGQLIIEDCNGNQDVFNAPFTSPQNYSITGQTPDGGACDVTAYFTDDLPCTQTINYTAPTCICNIDNFQVLIGLCDQNTDTYCMTGDIQFTNPPSVGTMIVEVNNGTTIYDTIINMPFVSGQTFSICGIPSDGSASTITVYFSNDPGCSSTINYTAPTSCACDAEIGTFNTNITGSSTNNYVLCYGDGIDITTNGDWVGPGEMFNPPGPVYNPGVTWLIYTCPPTVAVVPNLIDNVPDDPCFLGVATDNDLIDANNGGSWFDAYPPGTFTNNTVYFVPLTFYDQAGLTYSYVNGTMPCYEMGPYYDVQYLPQFSFSFTDDCIAGTADITVTGGLPAVDGSLFTGSNLQPGTASFVNTSATDGGIIQITGLQGGDMWSFDVIDGNGCPYTVSGGPFPPLEDPSFAYPQTSWCTSEAPMGPSSVSTSGGTFTSAPAGLTINAATGQITPSTSTPGTYNVTYTTPGTCFDDSTIVVNIAATPMVNPIADQTICNGSNFTDIIFTGSAGSIFDWTNNNVNIGLGASGTGDILAFAGTAGLVQESGTITVTPSAGTCVGTPEQFVLTVDPTEDPSFNYPAPGWCTSVVVQSPIITGTNGGTFAALPAGLSINVGTGDITPATSTPGIYDVTYTTPGPCTATSVVQIEIYAVPTVDPTTNETVCVGSNFTAVNFTGPIAGTLFNWANDNTGIGLTAGAAGNIVAFPGATTGGTISGNITVTPSTANCTGPTEVFILTVNDLDDPSFAYAPGLTYCQTATDPVINITGLTGGTFSYTVVSGGPTLNLNTATGDVVLVTSDLGAYDITYTTAGGLGSLCPSTLTLQLVITAGPIADFTLGTYCANDADPLPTYINGGSGGTYTSVPAGLSINPGSGLVDLSASTPGTYTVTNDINVAGCPLATYNDDITVYELPTANIIGTASICTGDPLPDVTIDITAGAPNWDVTYNFNAAPSVVNTGASPYTIAGAAVGTYDLVSITDGNGCTNTINGQVIISEFPTPVVDPLLDQAFCSQDNLVIQTFTSTPVGATFAWTNTTGTDIGFGLSGNGQIGSFTGNNANPIPEQVTIEVIPTSADGCVGPAETFLVTVNPLPNILFSGTPLNGCEPLTVQFDNLTAPLGQNCVWNFGNGNTANGCGIVFETYMEGSYDVTLTVTTAEGCTATDTYVSYVNVTPEPEAAFSFLPQNIDVTDPVVDFYNNSNNAVSYTWDFDDGSPLSMFEEGAHLYPQEPGEYLVELIAYDANSWCPDTVSALIVVDDIILFYVPNVMTPDGDMFNEIFLPVFTSGFDKYDYHLTIFNRWGEIVFESYDALVGWNGNYGDGGLVQDGVYIWQIDFAETMSDKRHTHRGHVTVLK